MEEENRCWFCDRRNLSGYCLPLKKMVKGGNEVFGCKHFVPKKKDNPGHNNPSRSGGCASC